VTAPEDTIEDLQARIARLEDKITNQRWQIRNHQDALRDRNRQLDAWHWVWCDGGCPGGVHRYKDEDGIYRQVPLTEEIVREAELGAKRLRRWWANYQYRSAFANGRHNRWYALDRKVRYGPRWLRWWYRRQLGKMQKPEWPSVYDRNNERRQLP
jgi:hypothetical protein